MAFSLRTAAQHTGTSKSTILRAIKSGRLSATREVDGTYTIDASELERVYPADRPKRRDAEAMEHHATSPSAEGYLGGPVAALEVEIAGLREILRRADDAIDELRQDRDKWRVMSISKQRLLCDLRPRSWWHRLVA